MKPITTPNGKKSYKSMAVNKNKDAAFSRSDTSASKDKQTTKPKRFYKTVAVKETDGNYSVMLDERPIKTPLKQLFAVNNEKMANAIADEWQAQQTHIDHETMIFTKLANTAIDRVSSRRDEIIDEIISYASSDLICYRATDPDELIKQEANHWNPILDWLKSDHDIEMKIATGIIHVEQSSEALAKIKKLYDTYNDFALTAIHNKTSILGSALLPLALLQGKWPLEEIWAAAHIDEDYQIKRWGEDEAAAIRRTHRLNEFKKTYSFYLLTIPPEN